MQYKHIRYKTPFHQMKTLVNLHSNYNQYFKAVSIVIINFDFNTIFPQYFSR